MVDTWKKPEATPAVAYFIFITANIVSLVGGKDWTIEERFYQCCGIFLCAVILVCRGRRIKIRAIRVIRER
jgi:hypothetical protein